MIRLASVIAAGGVAVFPADTVYGLACDPENEGAVERLYALKGRVPDKPAAVMFFHRHAVDIEVGERTAALMDALLPGRVTLLLPNPARRYPLACAGDPSVVGLRVPDIPALSPWRRPVLQSSANLSGGADARRLEEVPPEIRAGADLVIDGGELPGTPSTVVDLTRFEATGEWELRREGAVAGAEIERAVAAV